MAVVLALQEEISISFPVFLVRMLVASLVGTVLVVDFGSISMGLGVSMQLTPMGLTQAPNALPEWARTLLLQGLREMETPVAPVLVQAHSQTSRCEPFTPYLWLLFTLTFILDGTLMRVGRMCRQYMRSICA
jgi:hypothetical protein